MDDGAKTLEQAVAMLHMAASGGTTEADWLSFVQIGPAQGSVVWNLTATTVTANKCHFSIQYFPETITKVAGTPHATTKLSQLPLLLGLR